MTNPKQPKVSNNDEAIKMYSMHLNIVHPRVEQLLRNIVGSLFNLSAMITLFCPRSLVEGSGDGSVNDCI